MKKREREKERETILIQISNVNETSSCVAMFLPVWVKMSGMDRTLPYPGWGEAQSCRQRPSHKGEMQRFRHSAAAAAPRSLRAAVMAAARSQRKCFPASRARIQAMLYPSDEVQKKRLLQGTEGVKLFRKYTEMNRLKREFVLDREPCCM